MNFNAYILDWSMDDFAQLRQELGRSSFTFEQEGQSEHIRVAVPSGRVNEFASLCQAHLNSPFNYVDIQYPDEKKTVFVFKQETFIASNRDDNERVRAWAIQMGLPAAQADWVTSF